MVRRLLLLLGPVLCVFAPLAAGETPCPGPEAVLFTSTDFRITCTSDRLGRAALLLTNLDDSGERLSPAPPAPLLPARQPEVHGLPGSTSPEPAARRDEPVAVIVRTGDSGEVEVRREADAGSTIVINIDNRQAPPPSAPVVAYAYPPGFYPGLPGPYQFPEHFHFLGVGHDNSTPRWFGGLALGTSRYADLYKPPATTCTKPDCDSDR